MAKPRPDFINVRLSDAALKQLGKNASVRVVNAHADYTFTGTNAVEVLRKGEWSSLLRDTLDNGQPMFQEAVTVVSAPITTEPTKSEA